MVDNCMAGYNSCMFAYGQVQTKVLCSGPLKPSPRSFQYLENPQSFRAGQILEFLETLLSSVACCRQEVARHIQCSETLKTLRTNLVTIVA